MSASKKIRAEEFDFNKHAFPFTPGEWRSGVTFTEDSVTFKMQKGPRVEVGTNGCSLIDILTVIKVTVDVFQKKVPCAQNNLVLMHLTEAIHWLEERVADRLQRDVLGTSQS